MRLSAMHHLSGAIQRAVVAWSRMQPSNAAYPGETGMVLVDGAITQSRLQDDRATCLLSSMRNTQLCRQHMRPLLRAYHRCLGPMLMAMLASPGSWCDAPKHLHYSFTLTLRLDY